MVALCIVLCHISRAGRVFTMRCRCIRRSKAIEEEEEEEEEEEGLFRAHAVNKEEPLSA